MLQTAEQRKQIQQAVLEAMAQKAQDLHVQGVAAVITREDLLQTIWEAVLGENNPDLIDRRQQANRWWKENKIEEKGLGDLFASFEKWGLPAFALPIITLVVGRAHREADEKNRGQEDKGSNYLALAMAKLAEALHQGQDSGRETATPLAKGEQGEDGGVYQPEIAAAFSGGSSNENLQIAYAATVQYLALQGDIEEEV